VLDMPAKDGLAFTTAAAAVSGAGVALASVASPANIGFFVVSLGPLGAAFIDTDPVTTPRASFSAKGDLHSALGSLFILGFPIVATIVGISAAGDASVGPRLALASVAPWAGLIWFLATTLRHAPADSREPDLAPRHASVQASTSDQNGSGRSGRRR
jgi:hypothetical protein